MLPLTDFRALYATSHADTVVFLAVVASRLGPELRKQSTREDRIAIGGSVMLRLICVAVLGTVIAEVLGHLGPPELASSNVEWLRILGIRFVLFFATLVAISLLLQKSIGVSAYRRRVRRHLKLIREARTARTISEA